MSPFLVKWTLRLVVIGVLAAMLLGLLLPGWMRASPAPGANAAGPATAGRGMTQAERQAQQERLLRLDAMRGAAGMRTRRLLERFDEGEFGAIHALMSPELAATVAPQTMAQQMQAVLDEVGARASPVHMQAMGMLGEPSQTPVQVVVDRRAIQLVASSRRWGSHRAMDQVFRFEERWGEPVLVGLRFDLVPMGDAAGDAQAGSSVGSGAETGTGSRTGPAGSDPIPAPSARLEYGATR